MRKRLEETELRITTTWATWVSRLKMTYDDRMESWRRKGRGIHKEPTDEDSLRLRIRRERKETLGCAFRFFFSLSLFILCMISYTKERESERERVTETGVF